MITKEEIEKMFEYAHEKEMLKRILLEIAEIQSDLQIIKKMNNES